MGAPPYLHGLVFLRLKGVVENLNRPLHVHGRSAEEEVHGGITVFGPGVDREVGLLDHDDPGDPVGLKLVKGRCDDFGPRLPGRPQKDLFDMLHRRESLGVTPVKLD